MKKQNCWEYMKCGRHPGGDKAAAMGVCPVSVYEDLNGVHGGENAGRACWVVDSSLCPEVKRETSEMKFTGCWKCDFFQTVKNEKRSSYDGFAATYHEMKQAQLIKSFAERFRGKRL